MEDDRWKAWIRKGVDNACKYGVFRHGQIRYMRVVDLIFSLGGVDMVRAFGGCFITHNGRHYTLESTISR